MQSYICLLCKKSNSQFISISFKNGAQSAIEDILELCGNSVALYFQNDDLVCANCMKSLDTAVAVKRCVFHIIRQREYRLNGIYVNDTTCAETFCADADDSSNHNRDEDHNYDKDHNYDDDHNHEDDHNYDVEHNYDDDHNYDDEHNYDNGHNHNDGSDNIIPNGVAPTTPSSCRYMESSQGCSNKSVSPRNCVTPSPRAKSPCAKSPCAKSPCAKSPRAKSPRAKSPRAKTPLGTSPNNLLVYKSSVPFDQRSEVDMEVANNKYRFHGRDTPMLDEEVQHTNFRRRRRSRGHNWTRRKGSHSSRSRSRSKGRSSRQSKGSRVASRASRCTTASRKSQIEQAEKLQKMRTVSDVLYQNDALSNYARLYFRETGDMIDDDCVEANLMERNTRPAVKTRFASGLRDKLLARYQEHVYECPVSSCPEVSMNLEKITEHRIKVHNEMAFFWCEQCNFNYLTEEHLNRHSSQHFQRFLSYCIYCSEEFRNKKLYEEHSNEHLIHSFPCIYCDKCFLKKQLCETHIKEQHPGRKLKFKRVEPQSIIQRIDKYPPNHREQLNVLKPKDKPENFVMKVLCQPGNQDDSNSTNDENDLQDRNCEEDLIDEIMNINGTTSEEETMDIDETTNLDNLVDETVDINETTMPDDLVDGTVAINETTVPEDDEYS